MRSWKLSGSLMWIHGLRSYIPFVPFPITDTLLRLAGSGKSVLWYMSSQLSYFLGVFIFSYQFNNHRRRPNHVSDWNSHTCLFLL